MDNPTIHTFSVLFKMVFHFLVKLPVTSTLYEVLDVYCYIPVQRIAFHVLEGNILGIYKKMYL